MRWVVNQSWFSLEITCLVDSRLCTVVLMSCSWLATNVSTVFCPDWTRRFTPFTPPSKSSHYPEFIRPTSADQLAHKPFPPRSQTFPTHPVPKPCLLHSHGPSEATQDGRTHFRPCLGQSLPRLLPGTVFTPATVPQIERPHRETRGDISRPSESAVDVDLKCLG